MRWYKYVNTAHPCGNASMSARHPALTPRACKDRLKQEREAMSIVMVDLKKGNKDFAPAAVRPLVPSSTRLPHPSPRPSSSPAWPGRLGRCLATERSTYSRLQSGPPLGPASLAPPPGKAAAAALALTAPRAAPSVPTAVATEHAQRQLEAKAAQDHVRTHFFESANGVQHLPQVASAPAAGAGVLGGAAGDRRGPRPCHAARRALCADHRHDRSRPAPPQSGSSTGVCEDVFFFKNGNGV